MYVCRSRERPKTQSPWVLPDGDEGRLCSALLDHCPEGQDRQPPTAQDGALAHSDLIHPGVGLQLHQGQGHPGTGWMYLLKSPFHKGCSVGVCKTCSSIAGFNEATLG